MPKRRYGVTEKRIATWTAAGRGTGRGPGYRPWLTIHDVPSDGLAVRVRGSTVGRVHHLLSGVERAAFLECDWSPAVVDIREQFPLPRPITRRIAAGMGVRHPSQHGVDVVMTTDLLIDVCGSDDTLSFDLPKGPGRRQLAIAVKSVSEDLTPRDLQKLEIERRYWTSLGVAWCPLFKCEMPEKQWVKLMWLHEWKSLDFMTAPASRLFYKRCNLVLAHFSTAEDLSMGRFTERLDREQGWPTGTALAAVRHLAANRRLITPVDSLYDAWGPLTQFSVVNDVESAFRLVA